MHNILRLRRSALKAAEQGTHIGSRNVSSHSHSRAVLVTAASSGSGKSSITAGQKQWCRNASSSAGVPAEPSKAKGKSSSKSASKKGKAPPPTSAQPSALATNQAPSKPEATVVSSPTSFSAFESGTPSSHAPSQESIPAAPDTTVIEGPASTSQAAVAEEPVSEAAALRQNQEKLRQMLSQSEEMVPSEVREALEELESDLSQTDLGELTEENLADVMALMENSVSNSNIVKQTPEFGGSESGSALPSKESLGENFSEKEYAAALIHGRAVHKPYYHPKTHHIPVANIQFVSHSPQSLTLFSHFATHAASSLGIPISGVVSLPRRRRLWTVIKGPFAHKKSQENFERITHRRAIKVWDADSRVVDLLVGYLRKHVMGGIGMRVVRWDRKEVGFGSKLLAEAQRSSKRSPGDKVREMGAKIVEAEKSGATEIRQ